MPPIECLSCLFVACPQELAAIAPSWYGPLPSSALSCPPRPSATPSLPPAPASPLANHPSLISLLSLTPPHPSLGLCLRLLESYLQRGGGGRPSSSAGDEDDEDEHTAAVAVCSLDLVASMVEGLGSNFQLLLLPPPAQTQSPGAPTPAAADLMSHLLGCLGDAATPLAVRSAALSAIGELSKSCPAVVLPFADRAFGPALHCLAMADGEEAGADETEELMALKNNAAWTLGLLLAALGPDGSRPFLPHLLHALVQLSHAAEQRPREDDGMLRFNLCVCLARLHMLDAAAVSGALPEIIDGLYLSFRWVGEAASSDEALAAWRFLAKAIIADASLVMDSPSRQHAFVSAVQYMGAVPHGDECEVMLQIQANLVA